MNPTGWFFSGWFTGIGLTRWRLHIADVQVANKKFFESLKEDYLKRNFPFLGFRTTITKKLIYPRAIKEPLENAES